MSASSSVECASCREPTPDAGHFCIHCGAARQQSCPSCGEPVIAGARFCMRCGTQLGERDPAAPAESSRPVAERRLVSVLFADLVGFTHLSEHRDPEEVRELLSAYFDRCRTVIGRYGGTVEKFIGDAVMAVWGTPLAREDDAERAVRAALSLTQMVSTLGEEVGMPELRLRAGVLTGQAAVEVGAESEGMVLGDTVNTASRLQSIATPGTVLVDDVTRRASEAAIAYEDAGTHEVKGREQPVRAWTALRVVAGAGGARRSVGLEAPFVGRAHELEVIIEAGERSAHDRQARHVAILGEAGSGKSRLLWEFFKYLDGIEELRYWHQGRCLSYGEGVAYWALAEMVRSRARIQEEEDPPAVVREKLRAVVEQFVPDERERRMVEPRLAHLLRLEERPDADRVDLFSGWRLFFERMAENNPVILAFEDLQWADSGLLDFIDYLLEWSSEFPILVLTLSRPELSERRPGWDAAVLGPLEPDAIVTILEGLVPGLPEDLVGQIVRRAEGIPLYAVETIRMLQDRGVLVQEGARYHVTGDVADLEVPESLHALMASRLDGLSAAQRSLLQDASVLGQSFTAAGTAALSGQPEEEVANVLNTLVARQILARDDDPRSPERGQYVFIQGLLRTVAYGTLSRRARKAKHVAAAQHLEETWPGELRDIAEVLASHYMEAIQVEPNAEDVDVLRASARERLISAGQAAGSLALGPEADRYFEQAAELADTDIERAELFEQAGRALTQSGDPRMAEQRLRRAIELYEGSGRQTGGRAAVALAALLRYLGRLEEARPLLEPFRTLSSEAEDDMVRAEALAELAALLAFSGELREAGPLFEEALTRMELAEAWASLGGALVGRAVFLDLSGRRQEGSGVLRQALALADEHNLPLVAMRARINLVQILFERDRFEEALREVGDGLTLARERGDRLWERQFQGQQMPALYALGRWEEAIRVGSLLLAAEADLDALLGALALSGIAAARGDQGLLARCVELAAQRRDSTYLDPRAAARCVLARDALERDAPREALELLEDVLPSEVVASENRELAFALATEAAMALDDEQVLVELEAGVAALPQALTSPLLLAVRARLAAELADRRGDDRSAGEAQTRALELLRSNGARPLLAQALSEHARRSGDGGALAEARAICSELGATRWLEQIGQASEIPA
jgi:class 3 adenylate cyclase/predicted ATPase